MEKFNNLQNFENKSVHFWEIKQEIIYLKSYIAIKVSV